MTERQWRNRHDRFIEFACLIRVIHDNANLNRIA